MTINITEVEGLISMAALMVIEPSEIMVTSFSPARPLTSFCAIKEKQIKEARRNPVPKQRCISVPHSGSGRGLSCSRLWKGHKRSVGLSGMHSPASSGTLLNHTLLGLLLLTCMMKIISFPFFFRPLYLPSTHPIEPSEQWSDLSVAAQCQATGIPEFRGSISDATAMQNITAPNSLDKTQNFPPASCYIWFLFLWTVEPAANRASSTTSIRLNCSTATDQEHKRAMRWGVSMCTGEPPNTPWF